MEKKPPQDQPDERLREFIDGRFPEGLPASSLPAQEIAPVEEQKVPKKKKAPRKKAAKRIRKISQ